jgi:hypothetical protein
MEFLIFPALLRESLQYSLFLISPQVERQACIQSYRKIFSKKLSLHPLQALFYIGYNETAVRYRYG